MPSRFAYAVLLVLPSACMRTIAFRVCVQVSSLTDLASMAELSGIDAVEARRTDERSKREELRCVLAVIRHGGRHYPHSHLA